MPLERGNKMTPRYAHLLALIVLVMLVASGPAFAQSTVDYDLDNDGYIDVANLAQLNAIRHDLNGNGDATHADYLAAFPNHDTTTTGRMGCLSGTCTGYELTASLDFDSDRDGDVDANDHGGAYWNNGAGWVPIGSNSSRYSGDFKGNGYTINNLFIGRGGTNYIGLFGVSASGARLETLGITNANVRGQQLVGILVGRNYGTIVACYTTGKAQGDAFIGGIVGTSSATISTSYSTAYVSGTNSLGGLVAYSYGGTVENSYSTGRVSGSYSVGGLMGFIYYLNSPRVTASYWDTQTSNQSNSVAGTGQTTTALQGPTGYTGIYANWNANLDGQTGNDNPWTFGKTDQYPVLKYAGMDTTVQYNLQPPGIPTSVTVTPQRDTLDVRWRAASYATGYKVQWKAGMQSYAASRQATVADTLHQIPNLIGGTTYTVRVIATKTGARDGMPSAEQTGVPAALGSPTVMVAAKVDTLTVTWNAVPNAAGYKVQWKSGSATYPTSDRALATHGQATIAGGSTTIHKISGLTVGTTYTVQVIATSTNTNVADSTPSEEVIVLLALGSPTGVEVSAKVDTSTVTWNAVPLATGYKVQWKSGSETYPNADEQSATRGQATIADGSTTIHKISGLTAGTTYTVRVIATHTTTAGNSAPSQEVMVTAATTKPTNVRVTPGPGQLIVAWTEATGATGYKVQWRSGVQSYNISDRQTTVSGMSTTTYTIENLTFGTTYTVRVTATLAGGTDSTPSDEVMGTPQTINYDSDGDGLIDIKTLAQLHAIRWDLNGDGIVADNDTMTYNAAFPNRVTTSSGRMGCPSGTCTGYELLNNLDFDENGDDQITSADATYWNNGDGWLPIGANAARYTGDFKGNGYTIDNLTINRPAVVEVGLFGNADTASRIESVGVINASVAGGEYAGALVGALRGTVVACYSTGNVSATTRVAGGLVGWTPNAITSSYSTASVSGPEHVGGLLGASQGGSVTNSYSTGTVTGTGSSPLVGGLIGSGTGGTASYWDTQTSGCTSGGSNGCTTSAGGGGVTGLTTSELISPTTYGATSNDTYYGWNANLDGQPGNDDPWTFGATDQYPVLKYAGMDTTAQFQLQPARVMLTLMPSSISESGGMSTVTATLAHPLSAATTITVRPVADAYTVGSDSTITIATGSTANASDTVVITAVDNTQDAPNRDVDMSVVAGNAQGAGSVTEATLTLEDDDPAPTATLAASPASISENGAVSTITASLSRPSSAATTITVRPVAGAYTVGSDTTITIAAGDTINASDTVVITSVDNPQDAPNRDVTVSGVMSNTQGAGSVTGAALTLTDDDAAPDVTLALMPSSISENSGVSTVTATLSHSSSAATTITVRPVAGAYTVAATDSTITIAAGQTANASDTVVITAVNNDIDAMDNEVMVQADVENDHGAGTVQAVTLTITDDMGTPQAINYDSDGDGLIDIKTLAQLHAIRWDLNGDGVVADSDTTNYNAAFPGRDTTSNGRMGCPSGTCTGYELLNNLDFDENGDGEITSADATYWNSNAGWLPIGTYTGTFKGNNKTISNLYINRGGTVSNLGIVSGGQDDVGLFGRVSGNISGLGLKSVNVRGKNRVGGLVGEQVGGRILGCYVTGRVEGTGHHVGGLVGNSSGNNTIIAASYADAEVSGGLIHEGVGGLVGKLYATVIASYAIGPVTGRSRVGGLVGLLVISPSSVSTSYATGTVTGQVSSLLGGLIGRAQSQSVSHSYWDRESSGLSSSARGTGQTTSALQSETDYDGIYANWNVDVDGRPGNDEPWTFGAADQYPVLKYAGMDTTAQFAMQPPGIPTSVTVTGQTDTLDMRWTAASYATGYKVQWKSGMQSYDASRQATTTETRHKISNLTAGTTYTVRVIATKTGARDGRPSAEQTGVPTTTLGSPTVMVAATVDTLTVTWNVVPNATGYKVQWKSGSETYPNADLETSATRGQATIAGGNTAIHKISGLTAGTTYTIRVIATSTNIHVVDSAPSAEQTGISVLGSPTGVEVSATADTLTVTWNAVSNATGYKVQWKSGSETYPNDDLASALRGQATIADGRTATYDISGLTTGTTYTIRVIATRTNVADSAPSEEVTGVPVLGSPTGVEVSAKVDTLTVTWNVVPNATGYKVQWKSGSETYPNADLASALRGQATIADGSATTHKISGLTAGTTYTIRVIATRTNVADSAPSEEVMVTSATNKPTNVRVTPGIAQLIVRWTEATGATGYKVQWKSGGQSYNTSDRQETVSGESTTTYTIENLTIGTTYTVRVLATLAGGTDSTPSDEVMGTPPGINYDSDGDGLIDIKTLAQLHAIRWDLNGDGAIDASASSSDTTAYNAAFPNRDTTSNVRMGCPSGTCTGYELMTNLNFDENDDGEITSADATYWNGNAGWQSIGTYTGTFKGNNKTIFNLYINRGGTVSNLGISGGQDDVGLFGRVSGNISGLGLKNVNVRGKNRVGGLVGEQVGGRILGCYVTGRVEGTGHHVGGLVGHSSGNNTIIAASYANAEVSGGLLHEGVGGLVGRLYATVIASYAIGPVTGRSRVGGLVGRLDISHSSVSTSYATGTVTGNNQTSTFLGGLIGRAQSQSVSHSYWDRQSSGLSSSARGTGQTTSALQSETDYNGIYANWDVDVDGRSGNDEPWTFGAADQYPVLKYAGMDTAAQFAMQPPGIPTSVTVTPQPSALDVRWTAASYATGYKVQWKAGGQNYDASRQATTTETRRKISNLAVGTTYTVRVIATKTGASDGRPSSEVAGTITIMNYDSDGDGLIDIKTLAQLHAIRHDLNGDGVVADSDTMTYNAAFPERNTTSNGRMGCPSGICTGYELVASLDFDSDSDGDVDANDHAGAYWNSGTGWSPIGNNSVRYTSDFKGNGHTINHLFISRSNTDNVGLFGGIHSTSRIETLGIINANVTGRGYSGILAGRSYGTVVACYTTGAVQGGDSVGGLVGYQNQNSAVINSSYSTASVSGASYVGGLVGRKFGNVTNSYSTGRVSGTGGNIGGLIGSSTTGSTTNSYWDTSTSTRATSGGGTGKTTSALQSQTTYGATSDDTYYNWNANLDGQAGNDDPWTFGKTDQYPVLKYAGMDTTVQFQLQPAGVMLTLMPSTISENSGVSTVTATLAHPLSAATTITVRPVADAYTVGMDSTITIAAGSTANATDTVVITAVNNTQDAPNRDVTVSVVARNDQGAGSVTGTALTITDDDAAPDMTLMLSPASISEAGGVSTVTATLTHPSSEATTITVRPVANAYTVGSDSTITIAAGSTANASDTVIVTAVDNTQDAPNRNVTVSGVANNDQGAGSVTGAALTITDDDAAPDVTMMVAPALISEAGAVSTVTATLSHPSSAATTITVSASAVSPAVPGDFTLSGANTLTVAAGATTSTGTVTITTVDNSMSSGNKTVTVSASTVGNSIGTGSVTDATLTIIDDEVAQVTLVLSPASISEAGAVSTVTATLNRTVTAATTITVSAMAVSPAVAGDFTLSTTTTLTVAASVTTSTGTVTITTVNNTTDAPDKRVTVAATVAGGNGASLSSAVTLTITDDDEVPTVTLVLMPSSISENAEVSTVSATLSHPSSAITTITVSAEAVSPATASDFTLSNADTLIIAATATTSTGTVTITAVENADRADDKTVTVSATANNAQGITAPSPVTLTLTDDDAPSANLDVDGDGRVRLFSDIILVIRYVLFFRNEALLRGNVIEPTATRTTAQEIEPYLDTLVNQNILDVDGDGDVRLFSDIILIIRYVLFFRNEALLRGNVIEQNATRTTAQEIEPYIRSLYPDSHFQ